MYKKIKYFKVGTWVEIYGSFALIIEQSNIIVFNKHGEFIACNKVSEELEVKYVSLYANSVPWI